MDVVSRDDGAGAAPLAEASRTAASDDARPWPSEAYGWYVAFVLCVCSIVAFIDRQIINLLVEDIKADLHISDTQVSLLQGLAFALFYALAAVPLGRLADTGSRRRVIMAGILVWTVAAAACGLARSFWQLFVARTFVGVAEATLTPSGFSMLGDLFRPQRLSLPLGVFTGASFFGSGVALLIGGYVISRLASLDAVTLPLVGTLRPWEAAFVIGALPGVVVALLFFLTVREPLRRRAALAAQPVARDADRPTLGEALGFVRANGRVFLAVFGGVSVLAAAQFSLGAWVPAYFIRTHGWSASDVGYAYGLVFLCCGTSGVVAGGWLSDFFQQRGRRDGHLRTALVSALATVPFAAAFPLAPSAALSVAALAGAVFFGTMAFGAGPALIPVICPARMRGLLVALYLLVANLVGQAGGPWIVAVFTDYVFGAPELVKYSLLVVPSMLLLVGAALISVGFPGLRAMQARAA